MHFQNEIQLRRQNNPKGIASSSPGLRGTSYPGKSKTKRTNPNGVAAFLATLGFGAESRWDSPKWNERSADFRPLQQPIRQKETNSGYAIGQRSGVNAALRFGASGLALLLSVGFTASAATLNTAGSLADTLARANDGDTVLVQGPTVFHEHLIVNKSIHLIGTNSPVIDGAGLGTSLTIAVADVEVSGVVVRNSGRDLVAFDCGILVNGPHAKVHDCRIESDAFGIYLHGVSDCAVERNEIFGNKDLASATRGNGIHLWKTKRDRIVGNIIHDKRDGIYLSYADDSVIAGNRVWDTRFGIHYMYSNQNRLLTNSLTGNAVGATLMFSRQLLVEGNVVVANRRHGLVLKQIDNSKFFRNVVAGQNRGFFVQQANQNRFEGNTIATNDIGLYLSNASEQNVFVGNAFIRNTDQVWQPPFETEQGRNGPNSFSEHGRGNYWSDYTGSDRNHDGIGDTPYHETDVFGYIVDRHPSARVLALSPAVAMLRKGEELMPLLDTTGVTDLAPLMQPVAAEVTRLKLNAESRINQSLLTSAATTKR